MCQVFVGTFFVFRNFVEKLCGSWAFSLVECVAVWMPMLTHIQASHTDVLKTHEPQSFSTRLLESKKTSNEYLAHFLWLKFGGDLWLKFEVNTSGTTLLLHSCLEGCIFTSLFGFIRENCTTHATLCINFLLFGCFRLNFLKIYATIFGIYEG